jgi:hypothetical protein
MYRSVKRLGIPDSNIILMLADDMVRARESESEREGGAGRRVRVRAGACVTAQPYGSAMHTRAAAAT